MEAPSVAVEVDNTSAATELNSGYIKGTITVTQDVLPYQTVPADTV
jgi:hypothetical protein